MAERQKGMGRGLAAILAVSPKDEPEELREIPLELISPNPDQPRTSFEEESLLALSESIRIRGVLQPVLVRPRGGGHYELIAGERRWRAAALAQRQTVPAIIREHDNATALEVALVENMAREDLNPVDEARACAALVEDLGLTREEVGLRVGRGRVAVSNLLRLLDLPDEALGLIERGELTEGHGRALLLAEDHPTRRGLARQAAAGGWSVRELETRARSVGDHTGTNGPRARSHSRPPLHPDQAAAIAQISDALGQAIGADVEVTAAGSGYRAHLTFESLDEALELARRIGVHAGRR